jgi:hypothetical protein
VKKFMILAAAAAVLALPVTASAAYGDQPGYSEASACGSAHGAFGTLGANGDGRHDLGQGDTTYPGSLKLGADGPATGLANSQACH